MLDRDDVARSARRIAGHVRRTPTLDVEPGALTSGPVTLKLEQLQRAGSFKVRGAFALLLEREVPPAGVVVASGGNAGAAVAFAARELQVPATVFVPEVSARAKIETLHRFGATVVQRGAHYADALALSEDHVARTGALRSHAYDLPEVVAGAGTCAVEVSQQVPDVDTILVAVGGAGLIGGIATWFQGEVRVIGVETVGTPTLHRALEAGHPVDVEVAGLGADALGARRVGELGFAAADRWVQAAVLVDDEDLVDAQAALWRELRLVAEPAAAAPLAALRSGAYVPEPDERVVAVISGANTDPGTLR